MDKIEIDNYFENIRDQNEPKNVTTMLIFDQINDKDQKENEENNQDKKENKENMMIIEQEEEKNTNNNNNTKDIMIMEEDKEEKEEQKKDKTVINLKKNDDKKEEKIIHIENKNTKTNNNNIIIEESNNDDNDSKKELKMKKRVRGPNKCYRIIDEFFSDKKRAKKIDTNNNDMKKEEDINKINEEQINNEDKNKKAKKRTKIVEMSEKFDEFLNYVVEKVNKSYYDIFIYPIINNYKIFYIEKEKEFKESKKNIHDENNANNIDENLLKRKKSYGLENFLEIPEIVNEYVKYIYNKNIFVTDESKIEMIEIIFIFCTWLKQYHYSSYSVEYLIKSDEENK